MRLNKRLGKRNFVCPGVPYRNKKVMQSCRFKGFFCKSINLHDLALHKTSRICINKYFWCFMQWRLAKSIKILLRFFYIFLSTYYKNDFFYRLKYSNTYIYTYMILHISNNTIINIIKKVTQLFKNVQNSLELQKFFFKKKKKLSNISHRIEFFDRYFFWFNN
jgi:hypothetical protein